MKFVFSRSGLVGAFFFLTICAGRPATITWTNVAGGNWNNVVSWSPNQIPGTTDNVLITTNGTYTITLDVSPIINSLNLGAAAGQQTLAAGSQNLTLTNLSLINSNGVLIMSGGSLTISNLAVRGKFNWNVGTVSGGTLVIETNGTLNLTNTGTCYLYGVLTNSGTVVMGAAGGTVALYGYDPVRIYNNGLWLSQSDNSRQILNADGLTNKLFVNTGTFRETGNGTASFGWPFTTSGTIDQQSGSLDVQTWMGLNTIHGTMNWIGGAFAAGSTLTIASNGNLNLTNTGTYYLFGVLTNNGTVVMGSPSGLVDFYAYDPARAYNNGLWVSQSQSGSQRRFINADGFTNKLFVNTGTFQQTGSGTTTFQWPLRTTGPIDQQGGLLDVSTWIGASILRGTPIFNNAIGSAGATVSVTNNTIVNTASGANLNGVVTVEAGSVLNLTNTGTYYLFGVLTNNGTVVMGSPSGLVDFYAYDPARAYNNGSWVSQSQSGSQRRFINADGLTNKLFVNTGTFQQTGSGTTTVGWPFRTTGIIDQPSGLLDVSTWIGVNILHGTSIFNNAIGSSGTIMNIATNSVVHSVGGGTLNGAVTVDSGGVLSLTNTGTYSLYGVLTNNGTVVMGSASGLVDFYAYDPARAYNNGLWVSQSLSGSQRRFINADGFTNKLFVNTGTFQQTGNGTTTFQWPFRTTGPIDQQGGLLDVSTWIGTSILHGILTFNNAISSAGATVNIASGTIVTPVSGGTLNGVVAVDSGGVLNLTNTGTYSLYGVLTNNGTVVMGSPSGLVDFYAYDPARAYNNGLWVSQSQSGNQRRFINADGFTNKLFVNAGTFQQTGSGTTTFGWPFTSSGTADIQDGTLSMNDLFVQTAGLTWLRGGTLSSSQPFQLLGGFLSGTNTVTCNVTNSGVVSPGLSPGKLTIAGNYTQTASGALQIELAGTSPGNTFDQLIVSGTARFAGTLLVSLTNGFVPVTNSTFTVVSASSKLGAFDSLFYPSSVVGMQVLYTANTAYLFITNAPPRFGPYVANGNFVAHFIGKPGTNYTIEWTAALPTTNWHKLTNVLAPSIDYGLGTGVVELIDPVTLSNRFYRTVAPAY